MTTMHDAVAKMPRDIGVIDAVLCEDFETVFVYSGDDDVIGSYELSGPIDPAAFNAPSVIVQILEAHRNHWRPKLVPENV